MWGCWGVSGRKHPNNPTLNEGLGESQADFCSGDLTDSRIGTCISHRIGGGRKCSITKSWPQRLLACSHSAAVRASGVRRHQCRKAPWSPGAGSSRTRTAEAREAAPESRAQRRGANLAGADLHAANLSGADLQGANLEGTNLDGANLTNANLNGAKVWYTNLQGADLTGATTVRAEFANANLINATCPDGSKARNSLCPNT